MISDVEAEGQALLVLIKNAGIYHFLWQFDISLEWITKTLVDAEGETESHCFSVKI